MFAQLTDQPAQEVLFSGQDQLPGLISVAGNWTLGALALLVAFKGLAWAISLAELPRRPDVPRDVPRRGRGRDGRAAARV